MYQKWAWKYSHRLKLTRFAEEFAMNALGYDPDGEPPQTDSFCRGVCRTGGDLEALSGCRLKLTRFAEEFAVTSSGLMPLRSTASN